MTGPHLTSAAAVLAAVAGALAALAALGAAYGSRRPGPGLGRGVRARGAAVAARAGALWRPVPARCARALWPRLEPLHGPAVSGWGPGMATGWDQLEGRAVGGRAQGAGPAARRGDGPGRAATGGGAAGRGARGVPPRRPDEGRIGSRVTRDRVPGEGFGRPFDQSNTRSIERVFDRTSVRSSRI